MYSVAPSTRLPVLKIYAIITGAICTHVQRSSYDKYTATLLIRIFSSRLMHSIEHMTMYFMMSHMKINSSYFVELWLECTLHRIIVAMTPLKLGIHTKLLIIIGVITSLVVLQ